MRQLLTSFMTAAECGYQTEMRFQSHFTWGKAQYRFPSLKMDIILPIGQNCSVSCRCFKGTLVHYEAVFGK